MACSFLCIVKSSILVVSVVIIVSNPYILVSSRVATADWFMALFLDGTLLSTNMDTSNFAHVIFQNVGKSYMPHAALECHFTLTQFIKPHPKDWVGIFKVNSPIQCK